MLEGYHNLLRQHAAGFVLSRPVDVPKGKLAIGNDEALLPIIPPVDLHAAQMPMRIKVSMVKTSDELAYTGEGVMFTPENFPMLGWMGRDLEG